jgi:UDP-2,4-diacetamido-2,4,6-trideoxy-beta-L-altropyranose hydrolase
MAGKIVFRADASQQIGYGHVMRCLSLADALRKRNYSCLFVASPEGAVLSGEVIVRGHGQVVLSSSPQDAEVDAEATLSAVIDSDEKVGAFILDHYGLDKTWEAHARSSGTPILVIDDLCRHHECDFLLDQNVVVGDNPYEGCVPASCRCFLGPSYALLRQEFREFRERSPARSVLRHILIFFGGCDPGNETGKALRGLMVSQDLEMIEVVIGAANPHRTEVEALCATQPERILLHVQTQHMAALMAQADLAIGAGGGASWERCCLRLPTVISVLADNQRTIANSLHRAGAALNLGPAETLSPEDYALAVHEFSGARLSAMSEAAGRLVDGLGAERVALELDRFIGGVQ